MKYIFRVALVLAILAVCSACGLGVPPDERIADKITAKTAKKLRKEKDLCLIGTGAQMMYEIEMLAMSFNYYKEVDVEQARELVVYATETYLDAINSNEKIRPYLANYPFTAKNIEIRIFPWNTDGQDLPLNKISCISFTHGNIRYRTEIDYNPPMYQESYEEALSKVKM